MGRARRILVIGCSGAGKSTFSRKLSRVTGLPYISMDRDFFWLPGWVVRDGGEIRSMVAEAVAHERWVMDGTGPRTLDLRLPRAEMVIWMRMPRLLCLMRVLSRWIRYAGRSRPEMADNCPEKVDLEFLRYIWTFERIQTPAILEALRRYGPTVPVRILRKRSEADALLARLEATV